MSMNQPPVKDIVEAALLSAGEPLSIDRLLALFTEEQCPPREDIRAALDTLVEEWSERPLELKQVGSGYRLQVRQMLAPWMGRLEEERPPRYSRALMETLALIVYRQPITRAGIEEIRGVSVSSSIIKTLVEREWVRVVGHRDVPGKPALYGTTRKFLDYFNLKSLSELPELADIKPVDHMQEELALPPEQEGDGAAEGQEMMPDAAVGAAASEGDRSAPDAVAGAESSEEDKTAPDAVAGVAPSGQGGERQGAAGEDTDASAGAEAEETAEAVS